MPSGSVSSISAGQIIGSKPWLFIISILLGEDEANIIFLFIPFILLRFLRLNAKISPVIMA